VNLTEGGKGVAPPPEDDVDVGMDTVVITVLVAVGEGEGVNLSRDSVVPKPTAPLAVRVVLKLVSWAGGAAASESGLPIVTVVKRPTITVIVVNRTPLITAALTPAAPTTWAAP
jgi:hypothetical protein